MLRYRFGWVSSGFREKTCQPTHCFLVLEAEIHRRPLPALDWLVVGPDRTGLSGWVGSRFCWTPLYTLYHMIHKHLWYIDIIWKFLHMIRYVSYNTNNYSGCSKSTNIETHDRDLTWKSLKNSTCKVHLLECCFPKLGIITS